MSNYLIWIIIIIIAILIFIFLCNRRYIKTNYYLNMKDFENRIDSFDSVPNNLQIVSVGSVFGRFAYDFSSFEKNSFNFAQSPQSLAYDYRILKRFQNKISPGCIVLITLPICIFTFIDYREPKYNAKYYSYMDKESMVHYNIFQKFFATRMPFLSSGRHAIHVIKDIQRPKDSDIEYSNFSSDQVDILVNNHLRVWEKQLGLGKGTFGKNTSLPPKIQTNMEITASLLHEMLAYCQAQHWNPILLSPPVTQKMNCHFSQEFLNTYLYDHIRAANKNGIPYLDFRDHPDFQEKYEWFLNGADMLTKSGRSHFMVLLCHELKKLGLFRDNIY